MSETRVRVEIEINQQWAPVSAQLRAIADAAEEFDRLTEIRLTSGDVKVTMLIEAQLLSRVDEFRVRLETRLLALLPRGS